MSDRCEIRICEPAPVIYCENGQIAVTDGVSVWLVIVTCEAMKATARPPEKSLKRLARFAEYYRDIAAAALHRGDDVDGKIWVTEAMVHSSPPGIARGGESIRFGSRARHGTTREGEHAQHGV